MNAIRKRLLSREKELLNSREGEIDILACATIAYSSEQKDYPVENIFDKSGGQGATRWVAAQPDTDAEILIEFDQPQSISRLVYEVEETRVPRTQELRIEALCEGFSVYRLLLMQQYTFSPAGATYQREDLQVALSGVTHLRLTVVPDQNGHGSATLTRLQLYG